MRALHVISDINATSGGPPVIASRLAAAQARLGHATGLFSYTPKAGGGSVLEGLRSTPGGEHVALHLVDPPADRLEFMLPRRGKALLRSIIGQYDFVHIHAIWEPVLATAASVARAAGVPYTVCLHGMLDPWCMSQGTLKKKVALALSVRRMLEGAAFLHLGNRDERELIKPLGLKVGNELIPNGVFIEEFANPPAPGAFRAKRPELGADPYILFLSRLHLKKGLDYLAEAFALVRAKRPDVRLVVAGADDGYKAEFQAAIARLNVADRVHLVGPLYGQDKLAAFVDAACFCLPSRQEGFSIAITESLAMGTPAVVTTGCHYPEVAEVGAGEVVDLDGRAVGEALLRVLAHPDRAAMGRKGQELIRTRFNWPAVAQLTVGLYQRACDAVGRVVVAGPAR